MQGTGSPAVLAAVGGTAVVVVVALALALGVLLLVARSVGPRRRRSAGSVHVDRVGTGRGPSGTAGPLGPSPSHRRNAGQPMTASFSAPTPAHRPRHAPPTGADAAPRPVRPMAGPPMAKDPGRAGGAAAGPGPTGRVRSNLRPPPSMSEPPVADMAEPEDVPPLPALRPKGALPANLPAMPAPPPADEVG